MISARAIVLQDKLASNYKIIPYKSYDMGIMRPLSNLFSKSTHVQEFRLKLLLQFIFQYYITIFLIGYLCLNFGAKIIGQLDPLLSKQFKHTMWFDNVAVVKTHHGRYSTVQS